jgi:hypothetical protein
VISDHDIPDSMVFQFEDWVLWSTVGSRGKFLYDPEPSVGYRRHKDSFTDWQIKHPGAAELAHIERLLTLLGRIPSANLRGRAVSVLLDEMIKLAQMRNARWSTALSQSDMPSISIASAFDQSGKVRLRVLSATFRAAFSMSLRLRIRSSRLWRVLSRAKGSLQQVLRPVS